LVESQLVEVRRVYRPHIGGDECCRSACMGRGTGNDVLHVVTSIYQGLTQRCSQAAGANDRDSWFVFRATADGSGRLVWAMAHPEVERDWAAA